MSRSRVRSLAAVVLLCVAVSSPPRGLAGEALLPLSAFPRERIAVETRGARRHLFDAWRADTPETRSQGLMFVKSLRPDQAMIFVYAPPQRVGMWMKNTLIPLDMLFVDDGGCVVKIHPRALPGDLTGIAADVPVVLVVELAGGTTASLGLSRGDRVVRPDAAWPRESRPCTAPR
jgi:uncharacterized membrane protein (UPF0127 family)